MISQHRWLPSLAVTLWVTLFVGLSCSPWRARLISGDGDAALHWKVGQWMIEHRAVLRVDSFSHTRPDTPVVTKEWLAAVLWGAAGQTLGWNGLVLLAALLIASTVYLLQRQIEAEGTDALTATLLTLLAALTCSMHWLARPLLFTQLFTVVFNGRLRAFEQGRTSARSLFTWLVPLMIFWANLHGAFPVGLVIIGLYFLGNCGRRPEQIRNMRVLGGLLAACSAATLLNPNGWKLHQIIIHYLRHSEFVGQVNEFLSPNFHSADMRGFEIQLLLLSLLLLGIRPPWSRSEILLIGAWGYFAFHSVRNVPIFALVVTPIFAEHLKKHFPQWWETLVSHIEAINRSAAGKIWMAVAFGCVLLLQPPTEPSSEVFPKAAVEYLKSHPDAMRGRMFNPDHWGGYLLVELPEQKVFMDSRHEFYGRALLYDYLEVVRGEPEWLGILDKYDVEWTLLPTVHPLNQLLKLRQDWEQVHVDPVAAVFRRGKTMHPPHSLHGQHDAAQSHISSISRIGLSD